MFNWDGWETFPREGVFKDIMDVSDILMKNFMEKLVMKNKIYLGDNLEILKTIPSGSIDLIYIDPPFNTGKTQKHNFEDGEAMSYEDSFDEFIPFIEPRLREAYRILSPNGTLYFHIDYREVHYCKVLLDTIFGRKSFLNEVIWVYDYGGRSKSKWSCKHDNILVYVKNPKDYIFNYDEIDRIPYMAPSLVGEEKAAIGKTVTDSWWHTIVPTQGKERTGYPTQKPLGILRRIIKVSSNPESVVMDFFAGSGSFGEAANENGRKFILVDQNVQAMEVMKKRFDGVDIDWVNFESENNE